jgi:hypothetical protein
VLTTEIATAVNRGRFVSLVMDQASM